LKQVPGACGCGRADADADGDGVPDCNQGQHDPLEADVHVMSHSARGVQRLTLRAGKIHAGRRFVVMGSLHGTEPGFTMDKVKIPLAFDAYTAINLLPRYPSAIVPVTGVLDKEGEARIEIRAKLLHGRGFWVGRTIHHAFVVLDKKSNVIFASNAVRVKIVR
jgi:hypothetical protein